jgi:hypothetical protein
LVPHPPPNRPPPELVDEKEEFVVEGILDSRLFRGKLQYLVKWEGYPKEEASWEPEENVKNAPIPIAEFHQKNPTAAASKRIRNSVLNTADFRAWREKNIRPSFIRDDAHPREGVMSRVPLTNHYSFLNRPKNPMKRQHPAPTNTPKIRVNLPTATIPLARSTNVFEVVDLPTEEADDEDNDVFYELPDEEEFYDCD